MVAIKEKKVKSITIYVTALAWIEEESDRCVVDILLENREHIILSFKKMADALEALSEEVHADTLDIKELLHRSREEE